MMTWEREEGGWGLDQEVKSGDVKPLTCAIGWSKQVLHSLLFYKQVDSSRLKKDKSLSHDVKNAQSRNNQLNGNIFIELNYNFVFLPPCSYYTYYELETTLVDRKKMGEHVQTRLNDFGQSEGKFIGEKIFIWKFVEKNKVLFCFNAFMAIIFLCQSLSRQSRLLSNIFFVCLYVSYLGLASVTFLISGLIFYSEFFFLLRRCACVCVFVYVSVLELVYVCDCICMSDSESVSDQVSSLVKNIRK